MKKTFKVVMLATEKAENSILLNNSNKCTYFKNYLTQDYLKNVLNSSSNHLYIISDDEIKEGDWVYTKAPACIDLIRKVQEIESGDYPINCGSAKFSKTCCKKIVATTDKSLEIMMPNPAVWDIGIKTMSLPQLPESFTQAYIKAYNEGKPITEVDLEIEIPYSIQDNENWKIKTRPDNTVIVHQSSIQDKIDASYTKGWTEGFISGQKESKMYSRDEVIKLLDKCLEDSDEIGQWRNRDKWIQDNL